MAVPWGAFGTDLLHPPPLSVQAAASGWSPLLLAAQRGYTEASLVRRTSTRRPEWLPVPAARCPREPAAGAADLLPLEQGAVWSYREFPNH